MIEGAGATRSGLNKMACQFQMDKEVISFEAGDFLFVPAGIEHRFFNFGHSPETWAIYYGPEGGTNVE